jgi:transposase
MRSNGRKQISVSPGHPEQTLTEGFQPKATDAPPDPEVVARPRRRQFSAEYKLRILKEADDSQLAGEIGALLRREGLYSSNLTEWRRQRDEGLLVALSPKRRGRAPDPKHPALLELEQLRREHERVQLRLKQAELIIEVQKKFSELLGIPRPDSEGRNS